MGRKHKDSDVQMNNLEEEEKGRISINYPNVSPAEEQSGRRRTLYQNA